MSRRVKVSKLKEAIRHLVLRELNEQDNKPEHFGGGENIDILGFQTKHFDICKSAVILYNKLMEKELNDEAKELVISSAKELDHIFEMEKQVDNGEEVDHDPVEHGIELTNIISFQLGRVAEMIGEDFERDTNFIKMHVMEIVKRHKREVDEVSTTGTAGTYPGGPGHYFTPYAFSGGRKKDKKKRKKISTAAGMKPVNESYSSIFMEISKAIKANRPDELDAIRDLGEEYDIGRVLYMARTNPKALRKAVDDRVKERKQFIKGKNLKEVNKQEVSALQKLHKGLEKLKNDYIKIAKAGDRTLMDREYNNYYETILTARKEIGKLLVIMKNKQMLGEGRYHDWRNDESITPKQKIGRSMREVRDSLNGLSKTIDMSVKLKTELKVDSKDYWKTTNTALTKISERLVKLANKVGRLQ